jgi:hypothetical protein
VLNSDDGGGAEDLAGGDQAGQVGERDPADLLGLVGQRRADPVGAAGQVELVRAVGRTGHRLERQPPLRGRVPD